MKARINIDGTTEMKATITPDKTIVIKSALLVSNVKELPTNALEGDSIKFIGGQWVALPPEIGLPADGNDGDVLKLVDGEWVAQPPDIELPTDGSSGDLLKLVDGEWVASTAAPELPTDADDGNFIVFDGALDKWVRTTVPFTID